MDLQKLQKIHQEKTAFGESITFTYCPRDVWGAQPPSAVPGEEIKHPVSNVRYMDTGTDTCVTPKDCAKVLQKMQKDHMENEKLSDIKYNFLVGGDGTIYEGRGWLVDAHRPNDFDHLKGNCIDVAYIGNMKDKEQRRRGFPTPDSEKYAYGWSVYGQKDKNYVEYPFTVIQ